MNIFVASASDVLTDHLPHGEGLIAWEVLCRLAARGHSIVACTRRAAISSAPPFEVVELRRSSLPSIEGLHYARAVDRELRRTREHFDVAFWMFPQGRDQIVWRAPTSLPLVVGPIATSWPSRGRPRRVGDAVAAALRPVTRARYCSVLRRARSVLVATSSARAELPPDVADDAVEAPFGVDIDDFSSEGPAREPVVAFVGSLEVKKGVRDVLESFRHVVDVMPSARLVFVGDGPERSWLEGRTTELGLDAHVRCIGRVPHHQVKTVLRDAAVCCAPSYGEPFGMVVLEAMACGRAVVTTDAGGPSVLVDDGVGGLVVPVGDRRALATALTALLADLERCRRMGEHNRARVEREYSWDRSVDRIEHALMGDR